ncbi:MAG: hypothetical protein K0Q90_4105, partial [Paenibacillaceae bacterium]|nr:hypothetical protein [Paenibacillaceae bacterium]
KESSSLPFEVIKKNKQESAALISFKEYWKRSRAASFAKGLLLATAVCTVIAAGYYGLFRWNITEVPSSIIEITEVSKLKNGRIAYHVKLTDGYRLNQVNARMGDDGIFYITPVRPVIKSRTDAEFGLGNRYDSINLEQLNANRTNPDTQIKAIYYGPKNGDPILLWEQGMELPPATDVMEAQFTHHN